jgi:hypothetical protein
MAVSDQDMLDAIDAAILAIVQGQVASLNSNQRGLVNLGIEQLQRMKTEYENRIARAAAASGTAGRGMFYATQLRRPE